jgi:Uma2 family endonuclease
VVIGKRLIWVNLASKLARVNENPTFLEYNAPMTALHQSLSVAEYLEMEERSEERHEYVDGQLLAMAGETRQHNDIVGNIYVALREQARARGCRVQFETVKVPVSASKYRYPDVFVSCAPPDDDARLERNPCLIVEVMSESTKGIDLGDKLQEYMRIPSLERYLIVAQDKRSGLLYKRMPNGWVVQILEQNAEIDVPCLETSITLEQIYVGLEIPISTQG